MDARGPPLGRRLNLIGPVAALLGAALWGAGDFFGGLASRAANVLVALVLAQALGCLLTLGILAASGEPAPDLLPLTWAAAAGVGGLVGLACLYLALSRGTMGLVAPLTALIAAGVPAAVGLASGDPAPTVLVVGIALALIAVVTVALPERGTAAPSGATGGASPTGGASVAIPVSASPTGGASVAIPVSAARGPEWFLIALSGLGFASFYLGVDRAYGSGGGAWWTLASVRVAAFGATIVVTGLLLAVRRAPSLRVTGALVPLTVLSAVGDTGGNLFYILARGAATLSVTVVLVSLYPVSTTILARVVLGERLSRTRLLGVALAVTAAICIGVGATQT